MPNTPTTDTKQNELLQILETFLNDDPRFNDYAWNKAQSRIEKLLSQAREETIGMVIDRIEMWADDGVIKTTDDITSRLKALSPTQDTQEECYHGAKPGECFICGENI